MEFRKSNDDIQIQPYITSDRKDNYISEQQADNQLIKMNEIIEEQQIDIKPQTKQPSKNKKLSQFSNKWITDIKINYPLVKTGFLVNTMVYKIVYAKEDKTLSVYRVYDEFVALRKILRKILPCSFILPAHKKRLIVL